MLIGWLGGARLVAQVLSVMWFLLAARYLTPKELGLLATGLVVFGVVAVFGDAGTTWAVARFVTAHQSLLWPALRSAARLRAIVTSAVGLVTVAVVAVGGNGDSVKAAALGVIIALASGTSELAYSALRCVGSVAPEVATRLVERFVFVVVAAVVLLRGGGPLLVLAMYATTNVATASIATLHTRRYRIEEPTDSATFRFDREQLANAASYAMLSLGPRLSGLLLVALSSPGSVGRYAVAARPVEGLALLMIGVLSPTLPVLRRHYLAGDFRRADGETAWLVASVSVGLPFVAWALFAPGEILAVISGTSHYADTSSVMTVMAALVVTWPARAVMGNALVSQDRSFTFVRASAVGVVVTLVVGIALIPPHAATGAAIALIAGEAVGVALLARAVRPRVDAEWRWVVEATAGTFGVYAVMYAVVGTRSTVAGMTVTAITTGLVLLRWWVSHQSAAG